MRDATSRVDTGQEGASASRERDYLPFQETRHVMQKQEKQTVVIADYDYGNVDIERAIIESAGLELVAAQCKSEDDVIYVARDANAVIAQYAPVGAKAINAFTRC